MNVIKKCTISTSIYIALTLLAATTPIYAFRFVVYSDCRAPKADWEKPFPYNLFNKDVLEYINSQVVTLNPRPAFVMVMGDLINRAYPKADPAITSNLDYWKTFMTNGLQGINLYVAVGNSDLYGTTWWTELELQTQFAQTFSNMPDNGPQSPVDFRHMVYSFEYGEGKEKSLFTVLDSFGIYYGMSYTTTIHCDNDFDPYPFPAEQINWFSAQAAASDASHKFVFAHGPSFSVIGYPVARNVKKIWDIALNNDFDTFFCAHEHIYYRWNIGQKAYPTASGNLIQNLSGTAGAVPDSLSSVNANPENRIYFGYNFVVVDIDGSTITEKAYTVTPNSAGGYTKKLFDTVVIAK